MVISMKNAVKNGINDNRGIGTVEIILILVVLIALVLIFKDQITQIVQKAFASITSNTDAIIN